MEMEGAVDCLGAPEGVIRLRRITLLKPGAQRGPTASVPRGALVPESGGCLVWQSRPLRGCHWTMCTHLSFPGLIPEETPESSFLLEGDILRPVSE